MTTPSIVSEKKPERTNQAGAATISMILWALWIILLVAGSVGVFQRLTYGEILAGFGSYVPWGLWIGLYFLGVGISGGSFAIGAVGFLLGARGFREPTALRASIVLSLAALFPAFFIIWFDLGRMERLYRVLTAPTFTSMMAFNAWMYNIFVVIAVLCWLLSFRDKSAWLKPLLCLGGLMCLLFPSQSGVFFEAVGTKEYWNSPLLSMLFLASAIALGAAILLLARTIASPPETGLSREEDNTENHLAIRGLRTTAVIALVVYLVFEFAEISITLWSPGRHSPSVDFLLFGPYWPVFWIFHLLLGAVVPLALFAAPQRGAWAVASLFVAFGFISSRMSILIPGQVVGQIPGLQQAFQDERLTYSYQATSMEYLVGLFAVALGMAVFYIGLQLGHALARRQEQKA
jgi:protein NrfD